MQMHCVLGEHASVLEDHRPDRRLAAPVGNLLVLLSGRTQRVEEDEAEALLELSLPLFEDRGRRHDDDGLRLLAQEQLARDQTRFDCLAETSIIGDEKVDAG